LRLARCGLRWFGVRFHRIHGVRLHLAPAELTAFASQKFAFHSLLQHGRKFPLKLPSDGIGHSNQK
jgi:hypothetical protein